MAAFDAEASDHVNSSYLFDAKILKKHLKFFLKKSIVDCISSWVLNKLRRQDYLQKVGSTQFPILHKSKHCLSNICISNKCAKVRP